MVYEKDLTPFVSQDKPEEESPKTPETPEEEKTDKGGDEE